jgi:hypothetical protein
MQKQHSIRVWVRGSAAPQAVASSLPSSGAHASCSTARSRHGLRAVRRGFRNPPRGGGFRLAGGSGSAADRGHEPRLSAVGLAHASAIGVGAGSQPARQRTLSNRIVARGRVPLVAVGGSPPPALTRRSTRPRHRCAASRSDRLSPRSFPVPWVAGSGELGR